MGIKTQTNNMMAYVHNSTGGKLFVRAVAFSPFSLQTQCIPCAVVLNLWLMSHDLMQFVYGHVYVVSLCYWLRQDRLWSQIYYMGIADLPITQIAEVMFSLTSMHLMRWETV